MTASTLPTTVQMLSRKEVAALLRLSVTSLDTLTRNGDGPTSYRIGGSVRYIESEVLEWIRAQVIPKSQLKAPNLRSMIQAPESA